MSFRAFYTLWALACRAIPYSNQRRQKMNSINKTARMAGFLYLIYMATHIISDVWRDSFIVLGDAAATISNIMAHEGLFTVTVVGDLLAAALFFLAAWALYVLLEPV